MADIALVQTDSGGFDMALDGFDLKRDDGLETAVFLSLFTDARATPDVVPAEFTSDDLRGYWGDIAGEEGDRHGSLLWTLTREKQIDSTLTRARQYASEALRWMKQDFVTDRVEVTTTFVARGVMRIIVDIYRPGRDPVQYRYDYEWAAQVAKRA